MDSFQKFNLSVKLLSLYHYLSLEQIHSVYCLIILNIKS